ncbi:Phage repressor protein C, contains Cro/C1-type HTH and peptisase s24 domains [Ruminococcaceae bacterium P7]|nr:Phage repressor protein C, contains Cro/C1-type HTH and peptisase s24 domains [Ruminococcaceae bacterium P7]
MISQNLYNSLDIADRIKRQAKTQGFTTKELLLACKLGVNTISKIANGKDIYSKNLAKIADYLSCSVDYLLGRTDNPYVDDRIIKPVRPEEDIEISIPKRILPFYRTAASAGIGSYLFDDTPVEYVNVPKTDKTLAADYILEVRGDSMEPKFHDGDCVLIQQSERIYEGQIGIFILNGESYIKKMGNGELISLNPAYSPIRLHEYDDIRCAGKVLATIALE